MTSVLWALAVNVILWIILPYYIGTLLVGKVPETPLTIPTFVYEFGLAFTILEVGAAYLQGKAVSVPFISGAAILTAVYLWLVTNGGVLSLSVYGIELGFDFRLLLYLFVVPPLWAAIKAPISYLIWKRAYRAMTPPIPQPHVQTV